MEKTLKAILKIGEQIQQALSDDELDTFYDLIDQREKLIAWLNRMSARNTELRINAEDASALEEQFNLIIELLNKKEEQMMGKLRYVDQFRKADQSYSTTTKRRQFINKNLRG